MSDGTPQPRSIAAELAVLFLRELEPRVPSDPELLVSTEAVLSFAAIRHVDPVQWEHWRASFAGPHIRRTRAPAKERSSTAPQSYGIHQVGRLGLQLWNRQCF